MIPMHTDGEEKYDILHTITNYVNYYENGIYLKFSQQPRVETCPGFDIC